MLVESINAIKNGLKIVLEVNEMPKASKSVNEAEGVVNARDMIAMMILIKTDQSDNAVSIQVNVRLRLTILSLRLKFIGV